MPLDDRPAPDAVRAEDDARDDAIVCARCGRRITHRGARIEVSGKHEHVHMNAHGYVHRVGCFREADGARAVSAPTREWTWFPGYAWQLGACVVCGAHVGWRFIGADGGFWGVALDAVRDAG